MLVAAVEHSLNNMVVLFLDHLGKVEGRPGLVGHAADRTDWAQRFESGGVSPGQPPIITVGQPGGRILPVGEGMGATQDACMDMSPTRAAGILPINTVADAFAIMPGPPGTHPASMQGVVMSAPRSGHVADQDGRLALDDGQGHWRVWDGGRHWCRWMDRRMTMRAILKNLVTHDGQRAALLYPPLWEKRCQMLS